MKERNTLTRTVEAEPRFSTPALDMITVRIEGKEYGGEA
jgi:hypothetical protein